MFAVCVTVVCIYGFRWYERRQAAVDRISRLKRGFKAEVWEGGERKEKEKEREKEKEKGKKKGGNNKKKKQ